MPGSVGKRMGRGRGIVGGTRRVVRMSRSVGKWAGGIVRGPGLMIRMSGSVGGRTVISPLIVWRRAAGDGTRADGLDVVVTQVRGHGYPSLNCSAEQHTRTRSATDRVHQWLFATQVARYTPRVNAFRL